MFVPTRSSKIKRDASEVCETVVFESKKSKKVTSDFEKNMTDDEEKADRREERNEGKKKDRLDMRKLRYDIIKFGTSGFAGSKKEESRVALAVSLGAKPPKRKGLNYKKILAEKKAEKEQKAKANEQNIAKIFFKKGELKRKFNNKFGKKGLLNEYGKIQRNR